VPLSIADHARVLQHQSRKQNALHLSARKRADAPPLEARKADGRDRGVHPGAVGTPDAAENTAPMPQAHRDEIVQIDGERAVHLGGLRQISEIAVLDALERYTARKRLDETRDPLEQRRLAGAVRADDGDQFPLPDGAIEVMDGRMPVVTERQVAKNERVRHAIRAWPSRSRSTRRRWRRPRASAAGLRKRAAATRQAPQADARAAHGRADRDASGYGDDRGTST